MPMPITRMFLVAVLLCGGLAPASRSSAQEAGGSSCGMEAGTFTTGSANHPRIKLLKSSSDAKTIFVVANKMAVNTDGSPRSYHLLDPKGQKYALNDICNAVVTAFEGGSEISCFRSSSRPRYYDILAQVVREHDGFGFVDQGYNPQQDAAYSLGGDFGLDLDEPE